MAPSTALEAGGGALVCSILPDRLWTADAIGILERTTASDAPRGRPPQGKEAMAGIIEAPTMTMLAVRAT
eukprot:scaffold20727_cov75-Phaeocystis_antarctica.AAC.5